MNEQKYINKLYIVNNSLRKEILLYGGNNEVYSLFDIKGRFILYSEINCFKDNYFIYKSSVKALYILIESLCNKEVDFLLLKILIYKQINNYTTFEMIKLLDISLDKYMSIEEGEAKLNTNEIKEICKKLNIKTLNNKDFFKDNFLKIN